MCMREEMKMISHYNFLYPQNYKDRVSTSIFSSACRLSGSTWTTGGRRITSGPPPYIDCRKFHVSSEIWPESAPKKCKQNNVYNPTYSYCKNIHNVPPSMNPPGITENFGTWIFRLHAHTVISYNIWSVLRSILS